MENQQQQPSTVELALGLIWSKSDRDSWERLNAALFQYLSALITAGVTFEENDFETIGKRFRPHYWFGASMNCKHHGETLYRRACLTNKSAALSYEKHYNRLPYILDDDRVFEGFLFKYKNLCCEVTGWDATNQVLTAVCYPNWTEKKTGRKLFKFDREKWLAERKEMTKEPLPSWRR